MQLSTTYNDNWKAKVKQNDHWQLKLDFYSPSVYFELQVQLRQATKVFGSVAAPSFLPGRFRIFTSCANPSQTVALQGRKS